MGHQPYSTAAKGDNQTLPARRKLDRVAIWAGNGSTGYAVRPFLSHFEHFISAFPWTAWAFLRDHRQYDLRA